MGKAKSQNLEIEILNRKPNTWVSCRDRVNRDPEPQKPEPRRAKPRGRDRTSDRGRKVRGRERMRMVESSTGRERMRIRVACRRNRLPEEEMAENTGQNLGEDEMKSLGRSRERMKSSITLWRSLDRWYGWM
ncbi:hypothetical protein L6452_24392 [Arctium lappa]|uniref:Uncharacterized protein n=1 Tax=Arctium lappa TaxID=4217 RepID=A0ACB9A9F1_ARCLA|nr:hypothetical protein L6452_24392 [Arctium lappa]